MEHEKPMANGVELPSQSPQEAPSIYPSATRGILADAVQLSQSGTSMSPTQNGLPDITLMTASDEPVPVVKVLSVRGVEYLFMSILLWVSAGSLITALLAVFNGGASMSVLAFPLSLLIVCAPGFSYLFLRLKNAELAKPSLRFDASKRRLSQITQVLAFLTCLINTITFVYIVLQKIAGNGGVSIGKSILNMLIILVVAGGVLVYYWNDEHRQSR